MDFRKATDALFSGVTHSDLAEAMGVSVPLIRQARLDGSAKAHRTAPEGWETAVADLAERLAARYAKLAERLRK